MGKECLRIQLQIESSGVACINTNRNFIGIELDKKYYDIAKNRLEDAYIEL